MSKASGGGKGSCGKSLGSQGGRKGGPARAKALTSDRRKQIAKEGAEARWKKQ